MGHAQEDMGLKICGPCQDRDLFILMTNIGHLQIHIKEAIKATRSEGSLM